MEQVKGLQKHDEDFTLDVKGEFFDIRNVLDIEPHRVARQIVLRFASGPLLIQCTSCIDYFDTLIIIQKAMSRLAEHDHH